MKYKIIGILLMLAGAVMLVSGGVQGGFFIVFPFIISSSPVGALGALFLMLGIFVFFIGIFTDGMPAETEEEHGKMLESRGVGFVMVGPVPLIVDTKNRKLTLISLAIFAAGILLLIIFLF